MDPVLENVGGGDVVKVFLDPTKRCRLKRHKTIRNKPARTVNVASDEEMLELEDRGPDRVRNHSVEEITNIMSEIPSKED